MPPELKNNIHADYPYATALLEWDYNQDQVVYRHVLPRENPLRIKNVYNRFIQGKAQNQVRLL